jgi:hypothetical protein
LEIAENLALFYFWGRAASAAMGGEEPAVATGEVCEPCDRN